MSHPWPNPQTAVRLEMADGTMQASMTTQPGDGGAVSTVELTGQGKISKLVVEVRGVAPVDEMFAVDPNHSDVMYLHPLQVSRQCYHEGPHPDLRFGPQYLFSPPPLVHVFGVGGQWFGVGLGAPKGRNRYSGWSYIPQGRDGFDLEVTYDGYSGLTGHAVSLWWGSQLHDTPYAAIAAYADWLRAEGFAPSPKRDAPDWWREPFACTWGEQTNLRWINDIGQEGRPYPAQYESQANVMRWLQSLIDHDIPFGVACTSYKWQHFRERLTPDPGKYPDFRGFADWNHDAGRHVLIWYGMWIHDNAPPDWCVRQADGKKLRLDPTSPAYARRLQDDVHHLISPDGYDYDGFFLDFTHDLPCAPGLQLHGDLWGVELLHHYVKLIHDAAKAPKPDALIMTHCAHPYFADVCDVFRLNDWATLRPNTVEQARYRHGIATACSGWLINTDNWPLYSADDWWALIRAQPELGIPSTWYTDGVRAQGAPGYVPFTEADYAEWKAIWDDYRRCEGLT
ncbi:MAG: TIM-barrel domain-containing protein [Planctomycetota bacterium]